MLGIAPNGDQRPLLPPENQNLPFANSSFGGPHPGVTNFVFADGSVRSVRMTADLQTLSGLATRSGNEVVNGDY
jgi:prepilin-type processing-associated H-X9-DG protein